MLLWFLDSVSFFSTQRYQLCPQHSLRGRSQVWMEDPSFASRKFTSKPPHTGMGDKPHRQEPLSVCLLPPLENQSKNKKRNELTQSLGFWEVGDNSPLPPLSPQVTLCFIPTSHLKLHVSCVVSYKGVNVQDKTEAAPTQHAPCLYTYLQQKLLYTLDTVSEWRWLLVSRTIIAHRTSSGLVVLYGKSQDSQIFMDHEMVDAENTGEERPL